MMATSTPPRRRIQNPITFTAAARAYLPPTSLRLLRALPLWYRWHTEGKGRKGYWLGEAGNGACHGPDRRETAAKVNRGRPKVLTGEDIDVLGRMVLSGSTQGRIAQLFRPQPSDHKGRKSGRNLLRNLPR